MPEGGGPSHGVFTVRPYTPDDLRAIAAQPGMAHLRQWLTDQPERILEAGPAWTVVAGQPIACGGFYDRFEGRAEAWAVVSPAAAAHTLSLVRAVRRGIALHPAERIEATTEHLHGQAAAFARLCGFSHDGLALRYCRGQHHDRWVILKDVVG